jgi:hypothetical protein
LSAIGNDRVGDRCSVSAGDARTETSSASPVPAAAPSRSRQVGVWARGRRRNDAPRGSRRRVFFVRPGRLRHGRRPARRPRFVGVGADSVGRFGERGSASDRAVVRKKGYQMPRNTVHGYLQSVSPTVPDAALRTRRGGWTTAHGNGRREGRDTRIGRKRALLPSNKELRDRRRGTRARGTSRGRGPTRSGGQSETGFGRFGIRSS